MKVWRRFSHSPWGEVFWMSYFLAVAIIGQSDWVTIPAAFAAGGFLIFAIEKFGERFDERRTKGES
jgi:hypothetical protein